MFRLTHDLLAQVCANNRFPAPTREMVFVGLRGAVPVRPAEHSFAAAVDLEPAELDYRRPRCTLVQWKPGERLIAAFPASTVPHESVIQPSRSDTFNRLFTGYYVDAFARGSHHRLPNPNAHDAFVERREFMIMRTSNDATFDAATDDVMKGFPADNLHAAWCSLDSPVGHYSSEGCQVVVGFPSTLDGSRQGSGPWLDFKANGYAGAQTVFDYLLIDGAEAGLMAADPQAVSRRLRFGSQGSEVTALQQALARAGDFAARPDTDFGPQTLLALIGFQRRDLWHQSDRVDGIAGPRAFSALGLPV